MPNLKGSVRQTGPTCATPNKIIISTTLIPAAPPPLPGRFAVLRSLFLFSGATACSATVCRFCSPHVLPMFSAGSPPVLPLSSACHPYPKAPGSARGHSLPALPLPAPSALPPPSPPFPSSAAAYTTDRNGSCPYRVGRAFRWDRTWREMVCSWETALHRYGNIPIPRAPHGFQEE